MDKCNREQVDDRSTMLGYIFPEVIVLFNIQDVGYP